MTLQKITLIYLFLLIFPTLIFAQEVHEAVKYAEKAHELVAEDNYPAAAQYFDTAAMVEILRDEPFLPLIAECYMNSGICYEVIPQYGQAISGYDKAMRVYQIMEDSVQTEEMLSDIIRCYNLLISEDLEANFQPRAKKQSTSIHFRASVIVDESNDSIWVLVDGGSNDGLFKGAKGQALGVYDEVYKERGNRVLGKAEVVDVNPNFSQVLVIIADQEDPEGRVYSGDMILLPSIVPINENPSAFYELALLNIDFLDISSEPLYHARHLFFFDSFELEELMLKIMKSDIDETAEWVRTEAKDDTAYFGLIETGRFKGLNMVEAMEQSDNEDIKAFLEFVISFPGKYMGHSWKINETYATWIINNTPLGSREMKRMLLSAKDDKEFGEILMEHINDFDNGDFFNVWDTESDELSTKGYFEEARKINDLLFKIAEVTNNETLRAWSHFDKANILEDEQQYIEAIAEYDLAREIFTRTDNIRGESFCVNNTASLYNNLGNYEEALLSYQDSYRLKLERLQSDSSDAVIISTGVSAEGKGLSLYNMGRYPEAFEAFNEAFSSYQRAKSIEGTQNTADILGWLGESMKSMSNYDSSLYYYNQQLRLQRELGNISGEADAIDNIAYAYSSKGNEKKANELYYRSYEIYLGLDNKNSAGFSMSNVGQTYWILGEYEKAIESHSRAISLRIEANNRKGQAYSWNKLGSLYSENSNPVKALEAFAKAGELYSAIDDKQAQGDVYENMGTMYYDVGDHIQAIDYYTRAKNIYTEINSRDDYASVLANIGNVYYAEKKFNLARDNYAESLIIQQEINDRSGQMYNWINLGLIYHYVDFKFDTAEIFLLSALDIASEINSINMNAFCLNNLGNLYSSTGDYEEAKLFYEEALAIYSENGFKGSEADILISLGYHYITEGDFESAEGYFAQAKTIATEIDNRKVLANALSATGELKRLLGEFDESLAVLDQSLKIRKEVDDPWGTANVYIGYGNTYNSKMEYQKAISYYQLADSIYADLGNDYARATPINNIGTIYFGQHDYEKSLEQLLKALALIDIEGMKGDFLALVKANIGEVYFETKQYDEAEKWLDAALVLANKLEVDRRIATTQLIRGKLYTDLKDWDVALTSFDQAKTIFEKNGEKEMLEELYLDYGILYYEQGGFENSVAQLNMSMEISREIESNKTMWKSLYFMALNQKHDGEIEKSIITLESSIALLEEASTNFIDDGESLTKFNQSESRLKVYAEIVELLISQGNIGEAIAYLDKANSDNMKSKFGNLDPTFADDSKNLAIQKKKELETQIGKLSAEISKEKAKPANQQSLAKIQGLQEKLIQQKDYLKFTRETMMNDSSLSNYVKNNVNPKDFMKIKRYIPEDVGTILYLLGEDKLYLFVATKDSVYAKVLEISKDDVEKKVLEIHQLLKRPSFSTKTRGERGTRTLVSADDAIDNQVKFNELSAALYDILIKPVEKQIGTKEKLVIIPNGVLYYLPFQILGYPVNDTSFHYIIEDYKILYTSELIFDDLVDEPEAPLIVAMGNADNSLPFAEVEVNNIKEIYPDAKIYVREDATRDKVINIPENYNILHLATHGILDFNNFDKSYLVLAANSETNDDGKLTIDDIYSIPNLGYYNMVTLSACETAVTYEMLEGWPVTTASAFLDLGVVTVIASLWNVDDKATNILMKKFYENLKTMNKLDALRTAQLDMIHDTDYAHPYYWAPFLLIGDWR
jgi:CHAT domain-containing protein/Tfp pilus assembly protein PilF